MKDIMLDLETISLDSNAVVLSIGAVKFDLHTGEVGNHIEARLNITEQAINGGHIDTNTLAWWSSQSSEAKKALLKGESLDVNVALLMFNNWIRANFTDINNVRLWGNGVAADNVWIRNLYKRHGIQFILPYWCDTDVRTITSMENYDKVKELTGEFDGVKHDAIDDCKHQIKMCKVAYDLIKGNK